MKKKFIAKLLVLVMVLSMVPVTILAASGAGSIAGSSSGSGSGSNTGAKIGGDTTVVARPNAVTVSAADITVANGVATVEAKVSNGVALVSLSDDAVEALIAAGGSTLKIEAEGATAIEVSLSAKELAAFAEKTGKDLTLEFGDLATIVIPNEVLTTVFGAGGSVEISVTADGVTIQVDGKILENLEGIEVTML